MVISGLCYCNLACYLFVAMQHNAKIYTNKAKQTQFDDVGDDNVF